MLCFNIVFIEPYRYLIVLTQHSLNCLASIGDVKFKPQVSLLCGSFQYAKHSEANPIFVPKNKRNWVCYTSIIQMKPLIMNNS